MNDARNEAANGIAMKEDDMNRCTFKDDAERQAEAEREAVSREARAVLIARDNDTLRTTFAADFTIPGMIVFTQGVMSKGDDFRTEAMRQTMTFNAFTEDNDPHGEHDFGSFDIEGETVFFKIDYYADRSCTYGSEDPADKTQTYRVLTILLASEY